MEEGLANLVQAYCQARKHQNTYGNYGPKNVFGFEISDVDEPGGSHEQLVCHQQPTAYNHAQLRVPSKVEILQALGASTKPAPAVAIPEGLEDLLDFSDSEDICSQTPDYDEDKDMQSHCLDHDLDITLTPDHDSGLVSDWDDLSTSSAYSDQQFQSDADEIEIHKDFLVDHLMLHLHSILENPDIPYRHCPSSATSSTGPASNTTSSETLETVRRSKHPRSSGSDRDDEERGEPPNKRSKHRNLVQEDKREPFACPLFKHDPSKYLPRDRALAHQVGKPSHDSSEHLETLSGLDAMLTVDREHLYRRHTLAPQCVRCCASFESEDKLNEHQRAPEGCIINERDTQEGLTKRQIEKLKARGSMFQAGSDEEKWKTIYLMCFPDTPLVEMPTPCEH